MRAVSASSDARSRWAQGTGGCAVILGDRTEAGDCLTRLREDVNSEPFTLGFVQRRDAKAIACGGTVEQDVHLGRPPPDRCRRFEVGPNRRARAIGGHGGPEVEVLRQHRLGWPPGGCRLEVAL